MNKFRAVLALISLIFFANVFFYSNHLPLVVQKHHQNNDEKELADEWDTVDFEGFDNEKGADRLIVSDIVHLLYLQSTEIVFYQAVNIYSIYLNHKPKFIYLHCDNCSFHGHYWKEINSIGDLARRIHIKPLKFHSTIFGVEYGWVNHHRSDVLRLLLLMNWGGIFLDNDVYVVKSLHKYRKYEMTVSWDGPDQGVGVQIMIAHRNARLLRAHFDQYRTNYTPSEWYWNAGHVPQNVLLKNPELAHAVKIKLGTHSLFYSIYLNNWKKWRSQDTIHLLINHRSYLDPNSTIKNFDEKNILTYNYTYGEMCRDVLKQIKLLL